VNALLTAILDRNVDRVREITVSQPALLSERSASGLWPFEVAHSSGYIQIATALLRQIAPGSERITEFGALLEDYFAHLSHSHACAGWLSDIEFILWGIVFSDALPIEDAYGFRNLTSDELADLRFLSERSQSWPYWDEREQRACMASLTRFEHLYRVWYERQSRTRST
jgi:hypothetical protein